MAKTNTLFERRRRRTRANLSKVGGERPRLSVHRTNKQIYVQVIDDKAGVTLAAASTLDKDLRDTMKSGGNKDAAAAVGKLIAERATKAGVTTVAFDRGAFKYHGRVKALAEAAREGGLSF